MSHQYAGPHQPYPVPAYGVPGPPPPQYQSSRQVAFVGIALMGLTVASAIIQSVLMWQSYDDVKRFVYGQLSEDEFADGIGSVMGSGPLLDLGWLVGILAGIFILYWLWRARDNTEALAARQGGPVRGRHRHPQGWIIGSWICPIVQFWYPLQVVEDIVRTSEPGPESGRTRGLLYGWWVAWTGFWVVVVGGGAVAMVSFISWIVRLVDRADAASASDSYVDIYDFQDYMVRVALVANIGFTVASLLLLVAGVALALLMLRVTKWQDGSMSLPPSSGRPQDVLPSGPPQYAPRPSPPPGPRSFPSYGPPPPGTPSYGPPPPGSPSYGPPPPGSPSYGPQPPGSPWQG